MNAKLATPDGAGLVPGCVVGNKYRIDGCLGEGGMGVVLSATHLELDAPVAIKVVRQEYAGNSEMVERVLFEARAIARMRSNHVVRVLDVARLESGTPYIVMEQLQGVDLAHALWENGAFPVSEAISYVLQACDGVAEAHSLGIVHRDLKPGNLFLANTPEGVVLKVLDFGISKEMDSPLRSGPRISRTSLTSGGEPVGSPYYMAPEQMRASPDIDARADIWSLGAILFELLTGRCPFEGESITEVCSKVLGEAPPSLSAFASGEATELDSVIVRCLQKDPDLRYATVGELAKALRAWRPSEDVELPAPEASPAPRMRRRRVARLPLAMVGMSALLALGAVGFWQRHGSAASLDTSGLRPMIAAMAAPIWGALSEPPVREPEQRFVSGRSTSRARVRANEFQVAAVNTHFSPVEPAIVVRAPSSSSNATPYAPNTAQVQQPTVVDGDPPLTAADTAGTMVDPVSGRYGL